MNGPDPNWDVDKNLARVYRRGRQIQLRRRSGPGFSAVALAAMTVVALGWSGPDSSQEIRSAGRPLASVPALAGPSASSTSTPQVIERPEAAVTNSGPGARTASGAVEPSVGG